MRAAGCQPVGKSSRGVMVGLMEVRCERNAPGEPVASCRYSQELSGPWSVVDWREMALERRCLCLLSGWIEVHLC